MGDNLINKENNITSTLSLVSEDTLYIRKKSDGLVVTTTNDNMVCNAVDFRFSIWFHNNSRKTVLKTEIQTHGGY